MLMLANDIFPVDITMAKSAKLIRQQLEKEL